MTDEVDEDFSVVKIEIPSEDEISTTHQQTSFETGPRRSSRKRKPLVKTLTIDTVEEDVPKKPTLFEKEKNDTSHLASSKSVFDRPVEPLFPNISKLEKQLEKFLVIPLTRCDSDSTSLPVNKSKPEERPEDVGNCLTMKKKAKTNRISSEDKREKLKRYHREWYQKRKEVEKQKNRMRRERKRAELLTQNKALTQEDDNDCLAEVNDSWLTSSVVNLIPSLPPLSPLPIKSSATPVSFSNLIQKQKKIRTTTKPKGTGQTKNSKSKRKKKQVPSSQPPTDLPLSTEVLSLITKNPAQSLPIRLPHRSFQNSKKPTSDSMVDHNRYQMAVRYHLRQKVLQEKALKDSLNDATPLSIPSLYGTPFDELLEPEKEIVLGILNRFGSKINVEGEWTQKSAERRAAKDSELEHKREKLNISGSSVPCPVCESCFPGLPGVKEHLGSHFKRNTGQHWIKCKFCKTLCNSPYKMFDHYRYVHLKVKDAFCKVCGKGFGGQRLLKIHEFTHWSKEKLVEEGKAAVCSTCGKVIASHLMRDHELVVHGIAKGEPLLCPVCGEKKYSAFKMDEHIKTHMSPEEQEAYEEKRRQERERQAAEAALKKKSEYSGGGRRKRDKNELKPKRKQRKGKNQAPAESEKETLVQKDDEVVNAEEAVDLGSHSNQEDEKDEQGTATRTEESAQEEEVVESGVIKVDLEKLPEQLPNLDEIDISNILEEGSIITVIPLKNSTEDPEVKEEVEWEADDNHHDDYDDELQRIDQEESSPPASPVPIMIPIEQPRVKRTKKVKMKANESEDDSGKEDNDDDFHCPSDPDFEPDQEDFSVELLDDDFSVKRRLRGSSSAKAARSSSEATSVEASDAATLSLPCGKKRERGRRPAITLPKKIGHPKLANTQEEIQKMRRKWADTSNYNQRMKRKRLREKKFAEEAIPLRRARRMCEKESEPKPISSTKIKMEKSLPPTTQLERKRSKIAIRRMVPIPLQVYNQAHSLHNFVSSSDLLNLPEYARALEVTSPSVGHGTFEHPHWTLISSKLHCVCPSCGKTFKDVPSLSLHKNSSHPLIAPCCLICGKPSLCTSTHLVHQTLHSNPSELEEKYSQDVLQLGPPPPNRNDRLYKCSECPKPRYIFGSYLLKRHNDNRHSKSKPCSICGKPSKATELHKQTHFSVEERAKWWEEKKKIGPKWLESKIMKEKSSGVQIRKIRSTPRPPPKKKRADLEVKWNSPAICSTCGKVFTTIYSLRFHEQKMHTYKSSVRVNCPICMKPFADKYVHLPVHIPTHFGVEESALWEAWSGRWEEFLECVNNGKPLPDNPKLRRGKGRKPKEPKGPRGRPRKTKKI